VVGGRWSVVRPLSSIQHSAFKIAFGYAGKGFARFYSSLMLIPHSPRSSFLFFPPTLPPMSRLVVLFSTGRAL
jgi:hypothetical protein